ncbi:hypothetical protein CGRA01v4_03305 [Colletotrichum graminicola]|nr:hypothetical protein CGRA01v4_03305 [Colletotrichum graminicola]
MHRPESAPRPSCRPRHRPTFAVDASLAGCNHPGGGGKRGVQGGSRRISCEIARARDPVLTSHRGGLGSLCRWLAAWSSDKPLSLPVHLVLPLTAFAGPVTPWPSCCPMHL